VAVVEPSKAFIADQLNRLRGNSEVEEGEIETGKELERWEAKQLRWEKRVKD